MKKRFHKRLNRSFGGTAVIFIFLFAGALFMLLPTIYAVSAAFKPLDEIYIFPPRLFVKRPTLDNFVQVGVLADTFWVPLSKYVFNTVFISVTATVGHLVLSSMAAYPLAKHSFVGKNLFSNIVKWSLLLLPPQCLYRSISLCRDSV